MDIQRLKIKALKNTRDLGGMKTTDGKTIVKGKLIRSGRLDKLPPASVNKLANIPFSTIVDLRLPAERHKNPNTIIPKKEYIKLPLLCTATPAITTDESMYRVYNEESKRIKTEFGNTDNYMKQTYKHIILNEESKVAFKTFLDILLEKDGVLWHCSGGKDRSGITAMIVEGLLGVDRETIIKDYTASHYFNRKKRRFVRLGFFLFIYGKRQLKKVLIKLLTAKKEYITFLLDFIDEQYGGIINYCKKELGIDDEYIKKLREKYLV